MGVHGEVKIGCISLARARSPNAARFLIEEMDVTYVKVDVV